MAKPARTYSCESCGRLFVATPGQIDRRVINCPLCRKAQRDELQKAHEEAERQKQQDRKRAEREAYERDQIAACIPQMGEQTEHRNR